MKCRWRKNDYPPANKQPGEPISTSVKSPQMLSCEEYLQTLSCKKTPCQHYKPPPSEILTLNKLPLLNKSSPPSPHLKR